MVSNERFDAQRRVEGPGRALSDTPTLTARLLSPRLKGKTQASPE